MANLTNTVNTKDNSRSRGSAPRLVVGLSAAGVAAVLALAGCSSDDAAEETAAESSTGTTVSTEMTTTVTHDGHEGHGGDVEGHNHAEDGGPAPEGMVPATNPQFPVGAAVKLRANHMPGMEGEDARVVGVFDTTTYAVSYTPTDGSAPVTNHRWVVHEELENPGAAPLADGTEITINANHMAGMKGAKGTVDYSTQEPVYMVDIEGVDGGFTQKNHKWVTESELEAED